MGERIRSVSTTDASRDVSSVPKMQSGASVVHGAAAMERQRIPEWITSLVPDPADALGSTVVAVENLLSTRTKWSRVHAPHLLPRGASTPRPEMGLWAR
jgi:hypothetical protein